MDWFCLRLKDELSVLLQHRNGEECIVKRAWWKESVVYQIYPRSFCDTTGDGIGDLPGIVSKLDYIKELGADVIWLCPIYQSPNDDNGYDISDYFRIMEEFGTLVDFEHLLAEVHKRDMKLIMDLVVNHTSDEHAWFVESKKSRSSAYRDYYIWRSGKNGGPPNNWGSFFSGSAWEYHAETDQYYLHLFTKKQPDLNWENPQVRSDIFTMMRWWLDKGIDGFRMDVINLLSKHPDLPDMPAEDNNPHPLPIPYTANGPKIHSYLGEMKTEVLDLFPIMTVGEMPAVTPEEAVQYVHEESGTLNMVFHFEHMSLDMDFSRPGEVKKWKLTDLKAVLDKWQHSLHGRGWNSLYFNNHDQPRSVSRFGQAKQYRVESATALATILFLQQGTPFVYQGEELGMTNCAFERIEEHRDVATLNMYQQLLALGYAEEDIFPAIQRRSRDNARTPMQWDDSPNAGFTTGKPWIKVNPNYKEINAKQAVEDPDSVYNYYKKLFSIRRHNRVLVYGDYQPVLPDSEDVYAYLRTMDGEQVFIIGSFRKRPLEVDVSTEVKLGADRELLLSNYPSSPDQDNGIIHLEPYETRVYRIS